MSTTLTSKELHIAIKNGYGVQYVMERNGFETEDSLFEAIRTITPSGAPGFINNLKKNQKKLDRKARRNERTETSEKDENVIEKAFDTANVEETTNVSDDIEEQNDVTESPLSLEQLEQDEREMSEFVRELECEHKEMVSQRRDCMERFRQAKKALLELQRILSAQQDNVTAIYKEYEELAIQMQENCKEQEVYKELLESVRLQIAELKKVTVFVYKSGSIEVENADILNISEETMSLELTKLITLPDAEEFTIKELKIIAKVKLMVQSITEKINDTVELVFDSTEVQKFYETVVAA